MKWIIANQLFSSEHKVSEVSLLMANALFACRRLCSRLSDTRFSQPANRQCKVADLSRRASDTSQGANASTHHWRIVGLVHERSPIIVVLSRRRPGALIPESVSRWCR
jgi:hypothetical protein